MKTAEEFVIKFMVNYPLFTEDGIIPLKPNTLMELLEKCSEAYHAQFSQVNEGRANKEESKGLSDKYKLLCYLVRSCLEDCKNDLVFNKETTVDNFRNNELNNAKCVEIYEYVLDSFQYELSWNQMANGINLFLKSQHTSPIPELSDEEIERVSETVATNYSVREGFCIGAKYVIEIMKKYGSIS